MQTGRTTSASFDFEICRYAKEFWARLIMWGKDNFRVFPWRKTRDPYAVLVSETILRKTGATKAQEVFAVFLKKWPSPQALASDAPETVLEFFRPLGLPKRGLLIWQTAKRIKDELGGEVPRDRKILMSLPGVGRYTADAVLCFAFGERVLPLDAAGARTAQRVMGRLSESKRPWNDVRLIDFLLEAVPRGQERRAAFALIDFSNLVCKARNPACAGCLLLDICKYGHRTNLGVDNVSRGE